MIKLDPIGSMGLVYLPTCTIQINQMWGKNTSPMDLIGTDLMSDFFIPEICPNLMVAS